MIKPYTWAEIKSQLHQGLRRSNCIQTYGTIGSCNIDHDVDTIITKKPGSPSSSFFREVHDLFDCLDSYLREKYDGRLIRTSRFSDEEETKYIAGCRPVDLVFQVMTYVSFKQLKMHWYDSFCNLDVESKSEKLLRESYQCILGDTISIFAPGFARNRHEDLFIRMNDSDRINSHFPQDLLVRRMNVLYDFVLRKRLGKSTVTAQDVSDVRTCFYQTCDILDQA